MKTKQAIQLIKTGPMFMRLETVFEFTTIKLYMAKKDAMMDKVQRFKDSTYMASFGLPLGSYERLIESAEVCDKADYKAEIEKFWDYLDNELTNLNALPDELDEPEIEMFDEFDLSDEKMEEIRDRKL